MTAPAAPRAERDAGAQLADDASHPWWRAAAKEAIADLAASGRPFTSDDIHARVGAEPSRRAGLGALLLAAARRGEIVPVGFRQSERREAHARNVRVWQGTPAAGARLPAETVEAKAARYLAEGRIVVEHVDHDADVVRARCRGTGAVYDLGFDWSLGGWRCSCPARSRCCHLEALKLVTVRKESAA